MQKEPPELMENELHQAPGECSDDPTQTDPGTQQSHMLLLMSWAMTLTDGAPVTDCSYGHFGREAHGMGE